MAYRMGSGYGRYLNTGASPVTGEPMAFACWLHIVTMTDAQTAFLMSCGRSGSNGANALYVFRSGLDYTAGAITYDGAGNSDDAVASTPFAVNEWVHLAATFTSDSSREIFVNGVSEGTDNQSEATGTLDNFTIGTETNVAEAWMADVAIWSSVPSDEAIARMAAGVPAFKENRSTLEFYAPFVQGDEYIDVLGTGETLNKDNTPGHVRAFPPIFSPLIA